MYVPAPVFVMPLPESEPLASRAMPSSVSVMVTLSLAPTSGSVMVTLENDRVVESYVDQLIGDVPLITGGSLTAVVITDVVVSVMANRQCRR